MSLDVSKLTHARTRGQKTIAQCPACAEAEADQKGEHLMINENGSFGCVLYPGNSPDALAHRKRIFARVGDKEIQPLIVCKKAQAYAREVRNNVLGVLIKNFRTARTPNPTSRAYATPKTADKTANKTDVELSPLCAAQVKICRPRRPSKRPDTDKKCVICGADYRGWPESEFCSDTCARQHDTSKNPSRERKKYLRQQCRLSWQHATERTGPKNFDTWLHNFEERLERMRETNGSK